MKVVNGLSELQKLDKGSVVTIGVFDGVHIGHSLIIKHAVKKAKEQGLYSVALTFDPHPLDILRPKSYPTILTGLNLKLHLIQKLGINITVVIKFTKSFASMSAKKFIQDILVDKLNVKTIVVGEGFRFGAKAAGDTDLLKKQGLIHGFSVEPIALHKTADSHKISSTRIRNLLKEGKLDEAKEILGHPVIISGKVVTGKGFGSITGFHTANIETADKASVPKEGVYTGFALLGNKKMPAVLNIGPSPTFDVLKKRIEVHILSYDKPLYDKNLEVELVARLRGIVKFKTPQALSAQITKDIQKAKKILGVE